MTAREREEFEQEKQAAKIQGDYNIKIKEMEIEVAKLEAKWSSWLRLPMLLIKLPVLVVFAIGYCISIARKHEPSQNFWNLFR